MRKTLILIVVVLLIASILSTGMMVIFESISAPDTPENPTISPLPQNTVSTTGSVTITGTALSGVTTP